MRQRRLLLFLSLTMALSTACGGGKSAETTNATAIQSPPATLRIVSSTLPLALQGSSYSATLSATGGTGALHWSIATASGSTPLPGLSIDPSTGLLSGTVNFGGDTGFIAQVADSATPPQTATKPLTISAITKLTVVGPAPSYQNLEYRDFFGVLVAPTLQGGLFPYYFSVTGGSLPPGVRLNATGNLFGGANALGTFSFTVTVRDSFSPPQTVSFPATVTINALNLTIATPLPSVLLLNRPFSEKLVAIGGTKPYTFSISFGSLPLGLTLTDPTNGIVSGTPTALGMSNPTIQVTDSSSPVQTFNSPFTITVAAPKGRNDTPATATRVGNAGFFPNPSISPYVDPPNGTPTPGDGDYYKVLAQPGAIVHVATFTQGGFRNGNPLDTVIEITDATGVRLSTCRLPGDASSNFNSLCLNDDDPTRPQSTDSALDFQVPASASPVLTLLIHVIDWRGDARPDMTYGMNISGAVDLLSISAFLPTSFLGTPYNGTMSSQGGIGPYTWSVTSGSGSLPPGISMNSSGVFSGTPTARGTFTFTIQLSDAISETASNQFTIQVF